jgi:nucleoside 2-deoxyribosyltransferase
MYKELIPAIERAKVTALNPWDEGDNVRGRIANAKRIDKLATRRAAWVNVIDMLGEANALSIRRADGMVAVLDGVDVDSGTAAEIGYAACLGKWIVGYRNDFRRTGEDETSRVNLQVEYFILKSGGLIVQTLSELEVELRKRSLKTRHKR